MEVADDGLAHPGEMVDVGIRGLAGVLQFFHLEEHAGPGQDLALVKGLGNEIGGAGLDPLDAVLVELSAVIITTGMSRYRSSSLIQRHTSKPSMSGIMTSSRTRSMSSWVMISRAASPSVAVCTLYGAPAGCRGSADSPGCHRRHR